MVVGAPTSASDTTPFYWQMYEVTHFAKGQTPLITKIVGQPLISNNVNPTYGTDGRIIFGSDRPRNGQAHLTQLDEYLDIPITSGLWSLDPVSGDLFLAEHSPSGSFNPFVDSFGRLIFSRWDHLSRDSEGLTDRAPNTALGENWVQTANGTFNYADETNHTPTAAELGNRLENYPEPRPEDATNLMGANLNGNAFNFFFPWMSNEDGSSEEILNHIGRHELIQNFLASYLDDIYNASSNPSGGLQNFSTISRNSISNLLTIRGPFPSELSIGNILIRNRCAFTHVRRVAAPNDASSATDVHGAAAARWASRLNAGKCPL